MHGNRTTPLRFASEWEAEAAIDEFIADTLKATARGDMSEGYRRSDYRAVPLAGLLQALPADAVCRSTWPGHEMYFQEKGLRRNRVQDWLLATDMG